MLGTLVDTSVLLDILTEDAAWLDWSAQALAEAAESGPLWINPIIYAEVSVRFSRIEDPRGRSACDERQPRQPPGIGPLPAR